MSSSSGAKKSFLSYVLRMGLVSFIVCTFLVLVLALIVKLLQMSTDSLPVINQIIKVVSVAAGALLTIREGSGLFKGLLGGLLFAILSTAIFALLGGKFSLPQFALDCLICAVVGGIFGIFCSKREIRQPG